MIKHFEFDDKLKFLLSEVASMSELMEEIRREWCKQSLEDSSEADRISQCIMQMMTLKIQSVLKLSNGVSLPAYVPKPIFLDSASIVALLRCIYEEVFIFHNIFATESGIERSILINIWKIKGLNNKIFEESDESMKFEGNKEILQQYSESIKNTEDKVAAIKTEIEKMICQIDITEDAAKQVRYHMNKEKRSIKGYKFDRENGKIVSFTKIDFAVSPEEVFGTKKLTPLYRLLSLHSHPSYMGVEQFGQMYNSGRDIELLRMVLRGICVMSSIFINDFCKAVKNGHSITQRFPYNIHHKLSLYSHVD